jgi:ribosome-associated protein
MDRPIRPAAPVSNSLLMGDDGRMPQVRDVEIADDMIRLGQLMKLANLADSGGDAKSLLAAGEVRVNGEVETRRGRQLRRGDEVVLLGQHLRVVGKA